ILKHLSAHHGSNAEVIAYFNCRLRDGEPSVLEDLGHCALWDQSFADELVKLYQANPKSFAPALGMLDFHWSNSFARRLVELVVADASNYGAAVYTLSKHRGDWAGDAK